MQDDKSKRKVFLTRKKLAERWNCSTRTVSRMKKRGELPPSTKISDRIEAWAEDAIEAHEAARTAAA